MNIKFESKLKKIQRELKQRQLSAMNESVKLAKKSAKEYVAVDTGLTKETIGTDIIDKGDSVEGRVGAKTSYSGFLENGTSRQIAQPFIRPALFNNQEKFQQIFNKHYKK